MKDGDFDYILKEGIMQQEKGAHILDVNVGLPDIDEVAVMEKVVTELQSVTSLPLQIDTVLPEAMERAMRIYNGKPMIKLNGKQESMDQVFPLVQKYGGVVVALTIDEDGIPDTAEGRLAIAEKIICEARKSGIDRKDIACRACDDDQFGTEHCDIESIKTRAGSMQSKYGAWRIQYIFWTSETSCDQCAFLYDGDAARTSHSAIIKSSGDDEFLLCVLCADEL